MFTGEEKIRSFSEEKKQKSRIEECGESCTLLKNKI